ncbi:MAG: enoyl-CoA hydratase [Paracoccaceae bacterium]|nr:MAG: enoyl-CoA hydratase [Paracoccaceae bacterium]
MSEALRIRIEGRAGRITLTRPRALNALTHAMVLAIDAALAEWADDPRIAVVVIDAEGERAFCAGGDLAELYATGRRGDFDYGRRFWRDEYRMNARIARFPKPVQSFLHGYTMGGGVGLGCHASLRIVGESSRIAMPECGIGLVPDVGGSLLLARIEARHPGVGAWIGATGLRLDHAAALMGFADRFQPEAAWPALKAEIAETGAPALREAAAPEPAEPAIGAGDLAAMGAHFRAGTPAMIRESLAADDRPAARAALAALDRASPLSVACHLEMLRRTDPQAGIEAALALEYRFVSRCMEHGDFLEGIRAQIIDKDRNPRWRHRSLAEVTPAEVEAMLAPLGDGELAL